MSSNYGQFNFKGVSYSIFVLFNLGLLMPYTLGISQSLSHTHVEGPIPVNNIDYDCHAYYLE